MPIDANDNVYIKAGETLKIRITVRDSDNTEMNLIGASAKIGISFGSALSVRDCVISGSVVVATLTDEETSTLNGNYRYQIVLETSNGERRSLAYGMIVVADSLIDEMYGTNPFPDILGPNAGSSIIPTSGWIANIGTYAYKVSIPISGILSNNIVYVAIEQDDLYIAESIDLAPSCDTYDGGIIFYAARVPSSPMNFTYSITGGVV